MTNEDEERQDLGLPEHFTGEARDLVEGVLDDLGDDDPDAYTWAALMQVGELISTADRLDEIARDADYMATGSQGQQVIHPATQQARTARVEGGKILVSLRGKPEPNGGRFASGAGGSAAHAAASRWGADRSGGRSRKGRGA